LFGLRVTALLAAPVLVLMTMAVAGTEIVLSSSPYSRLYQALALEQCALLLLVLVIAQGVPGWVAARGGNAR
jgi:hypothetical protein